MESYKLISIATVLFIFTIVFLILFSLEQDDRDISNLKKGECTIVEQYKAKNLNNNFSIDCGGQDSYTCRVCKIK